MPDRAKRLRRYLPIQTAVGFITGLICEDWMTTNKQMWPYAACCQDPRNWEGRGEWREIIPEWQALERGTAARDVYCRVCGVNVNAHETKRFVHTIDIGVPMHSGDLATMNNTAVTCPICLKYLAGPQAAQKAAEVQNV